MIPRCTVEQQFLFYNGFSCTVELEVNVNCYPILTVCSQFGSPNETEFTKKDIELENSGML